MAGRSGGEVCAIFRLACVCLGSFTLLFTLGRASIAHARAQICVCEREKECLDGLHAPVFCYVQPCQRVEPDALSDDDRRPKAL